MKMDSNLVQTSPKILGFYQTDSIKFGTSCSLNASGRPVGLVGHGIQDSLLELGAENEDVQRVVQNHTPTAFACPPYSALPDTPPFTPDTSPIRALVYSKIQVATGESDKLERASRPSHLLLRLVIQRSQLISRFINILAATTSTS
jgi:hypothetical protein